MASTASTPSISKASLDGDESETPSHVNPPLTASGIQRSLHAAANSGAPRPSADRGPPKVGALNRRITRDNKDIIGTREKSSTNSIASRSNRSPTRKGRDAEMNASLSSRTSQGARTSSRSPKPHTSHHTASTSSREEVNPNYSGNKGQRRDGGHFGRTSAGMTRGNTNNTNPQDANYNTTPTMLPSESSRQPRKGDCSSLSSGGEDKTTLFSKGVASLASSWHTNSTMGNTSRDSDAAASFAESLAADGEAGNHHALFVKQQQLQRQSPHSMDDSPVGLRTSRGNHQLAESLSKLEDSYLPLKEHFDSAPNLASFGRQSSLLLQALALTMPQRSSVDNPYHSDAYPLGRSVTHIGVVNHHRHHQQQHRHPSQQQATNSKSSESSVVTQAVDNTTRKHYTTSSPNAIANVVKEQLVQPRREVRRHGSGGSDHVVPNPRNPRAIMTKHVSLNNLYGNQRNERPDHYNDDAPESLHQQERKSASAILARTFGGARKRSASPSTGPPMRLASSNEIPISSRRGAAARSASPSTGAPSRIGYARRSASPASMPRSSAGATSVTHHGAPIRRAGTATSQGDEEPPMVQRSALGSPMRISNPIENPVQRSNTFSSASSKDSSPARRMRRGGRMQRQATLDSAVNNRSASPMSKEPGAASSIRSRTREVSPGDRKSGKPIRPTGKTRLAKRRSSSWPSRKPEVEDSTSPTNLTADDIETDDQGDAVVLGKGVRASKHRRGGGRKPRRDHDARARDAGDEKELNNTRKEKSPINNRRQKQRMEQRQRLQAALENNDQRQKELQLKEEQAVAKKKQEEEDEERKRKELEEKDKEAKTKKGLFNTVAKLLLPPTTAATTTAPTSKAIGLNEDSNDQKKPEPIADSAEKGPRSKKGMTAPKALKALLIGPGGKKKDQVDEGFKPLDPPSMMDLSIGDNDDASDSEGVSNENYQKDAGENANKKSAGRRGRRPVRRNSAGSAADKPPQPPEENRIRRISVDDKKARQKTRPVLQKEVSKKRISVDGKRRALVKGMSQKRLAIEEARKAKAPGDDDKDGEKQITKTEKADAKRAEQRKTIKTSNLGTSRPMEDREREQKVNEVSKKKPTAGLSKTLADTRTILMKARQNLNYESLLGDTSSGTAGSAVRRHSVPPRSSTIVQLSDLEGFSSRSFASVSSHAHELGVDEAEYIQMVTESVGARTPRKSLVGTEFDHRKKVGDVVSGKHRTKKRRPKSKEENVNQDGGIKSRPAEGTTGNKGPKSNAKQKSDLHASNSKLEARKKAGDSSNRTAEDTTKKKKRAAAIKRSIQDDMGTVETSHKEKLKKRQSIFDIERMAASLSAVVDADDIGATKPDFMKEMGALLEREQDENDSGDDINEFTTSEELTTKPATWDFGEPKTK